MTIKPEHRTKDTPSWPTFSRQNWLINRRHALKGIGVSLALPFLECMRPLRAAESTPRVKRSVFMYLPNGVNPADYQIVDAGQGLQVLEVAQIAREAPGEHHSHQRPVSSQRNGEGSRLQQHLADRGQARRESSEHDFRRSTDGPRDRGADPVLLVATEQRTPAIPVLDRRWRRAARGIRSRRRLSPAVRRNPRREPASSGGS